MKYNSYKYYSRGYLNILIIVIPLVYIIIYMNTEVEELLNNNITINPLLFIMFLPLYGEEYSYMFPRQAMELYETILFRTFSKNIERIVDLLVLVGIAIAEIYYIRTGNPTFAFIMILICIIIIYGLRSKSLTIGEKNIIIGKKRLPNSSINDISFKNKSVIIKTIEGDYEIGNWLIKNKLWQLQQVTPNIINNNEGAV